MGIMISNGVITKQGGYRMIGFKPDMLPCPISKKDRKATYQTVENGYYVLMYIWDNVAQADRYKAFIIQDNKPVQLEKKESMELSRKVYDYSPILYFFLYGRKDTGNTSFIPGWKGIKGSTYLKNLEEKKRI